MSESGVIAGLDFGSDSIRVLLAEYDESGNCVLAGKGEAPSAGLSKGVVVNIEAARDALMRVVELAEQEAGRTVTELLVSLGGASVGGLNSRGVVAVSSKNHEISSLDVERVVEAAKAVVLPMERTVLHVLPQEYLIDDRGGVRNPLDMIGIRLEVEVHIVTALLSATGNMNKAVERAGYKVGELALGSLAAARSVLKKEEKELGVLLINIGASSTDYLLIQEGAPRMTASLPIGASQVSNDLAIVLKISSEAAEKVKCEAASCWGPLADSKEPVFVPGIGDHPPKMLQPSEICHISQARMEEIFRMVYAQINQQTDRSQIPAGVVLTGGGALLTGVKELAEKVCDLPVRIGRPENLIFEGKSSYDARWSTAAGLVLLGDAFIRNEKNQELLRSKEVDNPLKGLWRWMGEFF